MRASPLRPLHVQAGAPMMAWGPPEADVLVVEAFGELELEYAAIRKTAALFDRPQRATLVVTGGERLPFLNRMVTQELKDLKPFQTRRAFWLNRKGRIDADLRLIELGDRMIIDVDVHAAARAAATLGAFIITEEVEIRDATGDWHGLALHGPLAIRILRSLSEQVSGPAPDELIHGGATVVRIAGRECVVDRSDTCAEIGLELLTASAHVSDVYHALLTLAHEHAGPTPDLRLRPCGWHAFNIARIEAGTPLYNLDFGPTSLPHETGVLRDRVSFTKGCYLGQEVVARMESRGHSKRVLVGLRCDADGAIAAAEGDATHLHRPQPATGGLVFADADEPIGAVTSSTLSPMNCAVPVCFAAVKPDHARPGQTLHIEAEGSRIPAVVQPSLRFWPHDDNRPA